MKNLKSPKVIGFSALASFFLCFLMAAANGDLTAYPDADFQAAILWYWVAFWLLLFVCICVGYWESRK